MLSPRDFMLAQYMLWHIVHPSVCLSVTSPCYIKMAKRRSHKQCHTIGAFSRQNSNVSPKTGWVC